MGYPQGVPPCRAVLCAIPKRDHDRQKWGNHQGHRHAVSFRFKNIPYRQHDRQVGKSIKGSAMPCRTYTITLWDHDDKPCGGTHQGHRQVASFQHHHITGSRPTDVGEPRLGTAKSHRIKTRDAELWPGEYFTPIRSRGRNTSTDLESEPEVSKMFPTARI